MTTPQATLQNLEYNTRQICQLLEGDDHTGNITEILAQMEHQNDDIINGQQRLENLMNLIVKFLSKEDTAQLCVKKETA